MDYDVTKYKQSNNCRQCAEGHGPLYPEGAQQSERAVETVLPCAQHREIGRIWKRIFEGLGRERRSRAAHPGPPSASTSSKELELRKIGRKTPEKGSMKKNSKLLTPREKTVSP